MIDLGLHYLKVMTMKENEDVYFMISDYGDIHGVQLNREQVEGLRNLLTTMLSSEELEMKAKWLDESS